jgi:hypothetical protein
MESADRQSTGRAGRPFHAKTFGECPMAINRDKPTTTKPEAKPTASLSSEALQALLNNVAELKATVAKYQAEAVAVTKGMSNGKQPSKSAENEAKTIKAFAKAGFGKVTPRVDVKTFNLWKADGLRPKEGTKSLKINNLRLFHRSQLRPMTKAELAAEKEQPAASAKRQTKANVTELHPAS